MFPGRYTLYGTHESFFTIKLEAMLRYKDLDYHLEPHNPDQPHPIGARAGTHIIPALRTPEDWVLWDSTPIAAFLDARYPERCVLPSTPVQRIACRLLEDWIDEWFTRAAMWTRWEVPGTPEFLIRGGLARALLHKSVDALDEAERAAIEPSVRRMAATLQARMSEGVGLRVAATAETGMDIPIWFEAFLRDLERHLERHDYLLGDRPSVADFAIVGGARAHFAHDPFPKELMEKIAPKVLAYVERCWKRVDGAAAGSWLAEDRVPETWAPFFAEMERGYVRYLVGNREAIAAGEEWVSLDLGHGPVRMASVPYREHSRLDIRDEFLRLDEAAQAQVREAIPTAVLEPYLMPASVGFGEEVVSSAGIFTPTDWQHRLRMRAAALLAVARLRLLGFRR